jgi:hypothetical protein
MEYDVMAALHLSSWEQDAPVVRPVLVSHQEALLGSVAELAVAH